MLGKSAATADSHSNDLGEALLFGGAPLLLAKNSISTVTASAGDNDTGNALPAGAGTEPLYPNYIRQLTTKGSYTWTIAGFVSAAATGRCV